MFLFISEIIYTRQIPFSTFIKDSLDTNAEKKKSPQETLLWKKIVITQRVVIFLYPAPSIDSWKKQIRF